MFIIWYYILSHDSECLKLYYIQNKIEFNIIVYNKNNNWKRKRNFIEIKRHEESNLPNLLK